MSTASQPIERWNEEATLLSSFSRACQVSELKQKLIQVASWERASSDDTLRTERLQAFDVCTDTFINLHGPAHLLSETATVLLILDCVLSELFACKGLSEAELKHTADITVKVCRCLIKPEIVVEEAERGTQHVPPKSEEQLALLQAAFRLPPVTLALMAASVLSQPDLAQDTLLKMQSAIVECLEAAFQAFFSERWFHLAQSEQFAATAKDLRQAVKLHSLPLVTYFARTKQDSCTDEGLHSACLVLLNIGKTAADVIAGRSPLSHINDFRSFALLNMSVANAIKVIVGLPDCFPANREAELGKLASSMLIGNLRHEVDELIAQYQANTLQVVRFWLQHVVKLLQARPRHGLSSWDAFVDLATHMLNACHRKGLSQGPESGQRQLAREVQRFAAALSACLLAADEPTAQALSGAILPAHADEGAYNASRLNGRLLLLLELLGQAAAMTLQIRVYAARALLPAAFDAAADVLCCSEEMLDLQAAFCHSVLTFMAACSYSGQAEHDEAAAWKWCQQCLFAAACKPHPSLSLLLCDIWSTLIRWSRPKLAEAHMAVLLQCACAAASLDASAREQLHLGQVSLQLAHLLASLLQAAPDSVRDAFCQDKLHAILASVDASAISALACATLALHILDLTHAAGNRPPFYMDASAVLDRLGLELRQSLEAAERSNWAPSAQVHLAWLGECMKQFVLYLGHNPHKHESAAEHDTAMLAKEWVARQARVPEEPSYRCALQLLNALILRRVWPQLLRDSLLHVQSIRGCPRVAVERAVFAGQCGPQQLPPPVHLFHSLFAEQHWAVQHEVMEALQTFARCSTSNDVKSLVPPSIYNQGWGRDQPFMSLLTQYVKRSFPEGSQLAPTATQELAAALSRHSTASLQSVAAAAKAAAANGSILRKGVQQKGQQESTSLPVQRHLNEALQAVQALQDSLIRVKGKDRAILESGLQQLFHAVSALMAQLEEDHELEHL